jgi:tetratricopeptide (TPR) repeat protein
MYTSPYYNTWFPGERGYKEHLDRKKIAGDNLNAIRTQTEQFKSSIRSQTHEIVDQSKSIIASNQQIITSLDAGFDRLASINSRGFQMVTSAVEDLHSDFVYLMGALIQKIEYQNKLLRDIISIIEAPFETQVREFYNKACSLINGGILDKAIEYLEKSIALPTGDIFFPSHYQLGRLYLSGVEDDINVVDLQKATKYLLLANKWGNGIIKSKSVFSNSTSEKQLPISNSFSPVLSDCKFYLSQSYWFQLSDTANNLDLDFLKSAIKFCNESIDLNPKLSQGFYHLAKYHAYKATNFEVSISNDETETMLLNFIKAVKLDRNYLRCLIEDDPLYDPVFKSIKNEMLKLAQYLTNEKKDEALKKLNHTNHLLATLEEKKISESKDLFNEFKELKNKVIKARNDYNSETYFGYDDCIIKLLEV